MLEKIKKKKDKKKMKKQDVCGFCIVTALVLVLGFVFTLKPSPVQKPTVKREVPEELRLAVKNLESNFGTIVEQRENVGKISEALRIGTVSSSDFEKKGDWVGAFRDRVNVREALESFEKIKYFEKQKKRPTRKEINELNHLAEKVERQISSRFAKEEGLVCNFGQLSNLLEQIGCK